MLRGGSAGEDDTRSVYRVLGCFCRKTHSEKLTQNGGATHLIHHQASTYIAVIHTNYLCVV